MAIAAVKYHGHGYDRMIVHFMLRNEVALVSCLIEGAAMPDQDWTTDALS
jgi:hypothetical protein